MHSFWENVIKAVSAPLGFFVLALMVTETFMGIALARSGHLTGAMQFVVICMGAGLFVFVVLVVTILVWHKPDHLTFDSKSHLIKSGKWYGDSTTPVTVHQIENAPKIEKESAQKTLLPPS